MKLKSMVVILVSFAAVAAQAHAASGGHSKVIPYLLSPETTISFQGLVADCLGKADWACKADISKLEKQGNGKKRLETDGERQSRHEKLRNSDPRRLAIRRQDGLAFPQYVGQASPFRLEVLAPQGGVASVKYYYDYYDRGSRSRPAGNRTDAYTIKYPVSRDGIVGEPIEIAVDRAGLESSKPEVIWTRVGSDGGSSGGPRTTGAFLVPQLAYQCVANFHDPPIQVVDTFNKRRSIGLAPSSGNNVARLGARIDGFPPLHRLAYQHGSGPVQNMLWSLRNGV